MTPAIWQEASRYGGFFFGCQVEAFPNKSENFTKSANKPEITPEMLHTQKKYTKNLVDVEKITSEQLLLKAFGSMTFWSPHKGYKLQVRSDKYGWASLL